MKWKSLPVRFCESRWSCFAIQQSQREFMTYQKMVWCFFSKQNLLCRGQTEENSMYIRQTRKCLLSRQNPGKHGKWRGKSWHVVTCRSRFRSLYSRFSNDVTAAMLELLNEETAAMLGPGQIPREFNSIIMQKFSFVFVEKHGCWSREWKPIIA